MLFLVIVHFLSTHFGLVRLIIPFMEVGPEDLSHLTA